MTNAKTGGGASGAGHRLLPHTADVIVSAWAPSVEDCLREAVRGVVSCFADVAAESPRHLVGFVCEPAPDQELLVELLEEVIYLIDARDAVPVQVALARTAEGGLVGEFGVVACSDLPLIGPVPKAVSRHGLALERQDPLWRCRVIIDI